MTLATPCVGEPCTRWSRGHRLLPTQLNVMSRQPWAFRDAVIASIVGRTFELHLVDDDSSFRCWHHADLSAFIPAATPVAVAGSLLRTPIGYLSMATNQHIPTGPEPEHPEFWAAEVRPVVTDLHTGRGLDEDTRQ